MFRFLRKPFPMTDEEIINRSLKAVNEYAKEHKGDNFDIEESVKCAVKAIESVWRGVRHPGRILKPSQALELKETTRRVKPVLEQQARELAYKCMKKQKIELIKLTSYEAQITSELRARGYMFLYDWQKSKVRVTIKISDTLACTQEINYSDIKRGLLPALIADVAEIVDPLIGKNTKASVWTMSKDWNAWAKWQA